MLFTESNLFRVVVRCLDLLQGGKLEYVLACLSFYFCEVIHGKLSVYRLFSEGVFCAVKSEAHRLKLRLRHDLCRDD